jgi:hypothetical protein
MLRKTRRVDPDEFGMTEVRAVSVHLDVGTASEADHAEFGRFMHVDDAAALDHILTATARDLQAFWRSESLPTEVGSSGLHPAAKAPKASWRERSWALWRHLVAARDAIAAGELHRAARHTWFIGRISGEVAMARRHGRNARSGRNSKAALPRAHESQREAIRERLSPREAEIRRLDGLKPNLKKKSERAHRIKAGWKDGEEKLGLDKWVEAHNRDLDDKDKVRTLSEDRISRMLPARK